MATGVDERRVAAHVERVDARARVGDWLGLVLVDREKDLATVVRDRGRRAAGVVAEDGLRLSDRDVRGDRIDGGEGSVPVSPVQISVEEREPVERPEPALFQGRAGDRHDLAEPRRTARAMAIMAARAAIVRTARQIDTVADRCIGRPIVRRGAVRRGASAVGDGRKGDSAVRRRREARVDPGARIGSEYAGVIRGAIKVGREPNEAVARHTDGERHSDEDRDGRFLAHRAGTIAGRYG